MKKTCGLFGTKTKTQDMRIDTGKEITHPYPLFPDYVVYDLSSLSGTNYSRALITEVRLQRDGKWYTAICKETFMSNERQGEIEALSRLIEIAYRTIYCFTGADGVMLRKDRFQISEKERMEDYWHNHLKTPTTENTQEKTKRPPLGLVPKRIRQQDRRDEVCGAIKRYFDCEEKIPVSWIEEYNELISGHEQRS